MIVSQHAVSIEEGASGISFAKAYKLGHKRYSYNQICLHVREGGGNRQLQVQEVLSRTQSEDGEVGFHLKLSNSVEVQLKVYLCFEKPVPSTNAIDHMQGYQWRQVERSYCRKGCSGPILKLVQRFDRLSSRQWVGNNTSTLNTNRPTFGKDRTCLYLAFDEAVSHVGVRAFRVVANMYDVTDTVLLGTGVSIPVQVVANNDADKGAARMKLYVLADSQWEGWINAPEVPFIPEAPLQPFRQFPQEHQVHHQQQPEFPTGHSPPQLALAQYPTSLNAAPHGLGPGTTSGASTAPYSYGRSPDVSVPAHSPTYDANGLSSMFSNAMKGGRANVNGSYYDPNYSNANGYGSSTQCGFRPLNQYHYPEQQHVSGFVESPPRPADPSIIVPSATYQLPQSLIASLGANNQQPHSNTGSDWDQLLGRQESGFQPLTLPTSPSTDTTTNRLPSHFQAHSSKKTVPLLSSEYKGVTSYGSSRGVSLWRVNMSWSCCKQSHAVSISGLSSLKQALAVHDAIELYRYKTSVPAGKRPTYYLPELELSNDAMLVKTLKSIPREALESFVIGWSLQPSLQKKLNSMEMPYTQSTGPFLPRTQSNTTDVMETEEHQSNDKDIVLKPTTSFTKPKAKLKSTSSELRTQSCLLDSKGLQELLHKLKSPPPDQSRLQHTLATQMLDAASGAWPGQDSQQQHQDQKQNQPQGSDLDYGQITVAEIEGNSRAEVSVTASQALQRLAALLDNIPSNSPHTVDHSAIDRLKASISEQSEQQPVKNKPATSPTDLGGCAAFVYNTNPLPVEATNNQSEENRQPGAVSTTNINDSDGVNEKGKSEIPMTHPFFRLVLHLYQNDPRVMQAVQNMQSQLSDAALDTYVDHLLSRPENIKDLIGDALRPFMYWT